MAKSKKNDKERYKDIRNAKARRNYLIEETFEAGIALKGTEVKSIRQGRAQINDAFARSEKNELYLCNGRQLKLEASLFSSDRRWSTHLGLDVDPATDPMGDEFQWLTLSAGLTRDGWWLPGARIGYRQNLAGSELKYISLGVTAFKIVNIDLSSALDTVSIDGTTLPQGLMFSLGFQITW